MFNLRTAKQQRWRKLWPAGIVAILATLQLVLTMVIVGLETGSLIIDFIHSMIFAGYFCSLFFTITWISMFTVTCCNRHSMGCATHVLVENVLSIIAAAVLLYFDTVFLGNPFKCYFSSNINCDSPIYGWNSNYTNLYTGIFNPDLYKLKLALIKAQLACAAVMLTSNVVYLVIYTVVVMKTRNVQDPIVGPLTAVSTVPYGGYAMPTAPLPSNFLECPSRHTQIQTA